MTTHPGLLDELERDLGQEAREKVMATAAGQKRYIPIPDRVSGSSLAEEFGTEVTFWLAGRFGRETVTFPSRFGQTAEDRHSALRAAILNAGLTEPTRSANDIAQEFGVTTKWVYKLRREMRSDLTPKPVKKRDLPPLPLFPDVGD